MLNPLTLFLAFLAAAYAQIAQQPVKLDSALVTGVVNGTVIKYLGIPFAQAPRFDLPQPVPPYTGNITADAYGPGCIQQLVEAFGVAVPIYTGPESEDCLSINIIKPAVTNSTNLPVLFWIFGGGFQAGASAQPFYDEMGMEVVSHSVELEQPVIFVSINYRLSAYGFLASQEVANDSIGNIGLHDQRAALHWVKRYIAPFGGDPSRVTLWGQSSGAISAALHMTAYGGKSEDLFHGVFMQSGATIPVGPIQNGQKYYDALVSETGCTATNDTTALECLRTLPLEDLRIAVDKSPGLLSYQGLALAWLPRVDGTFIEEEPFKLVENGKFVHVPTVSGTCDDEGTFFSVVGPMNISTDADFEAYIRTIWSPNATDEDLLPLWTNYTSDPLQGSPFGEPNDYEAYKQYYRISAFQNDIVFQSPRRLFTQALSLRAQNAWVYLSKRFKKSTFPIIPYPIGSYHGSDLTEGNFTRTYVVNFANKFDPNIGNETFWPPYNTTDPELPEILTFLDPQEVVVLRDDYRIIPIAYLSELASKHPL